MELICVRFDHLLMQKSKIFYQLLRKGADVNVAGLIFTEAISGWMNIFEKDIKFSTIQFLTN